MENMLTAPISLFTISGYFIATLTYLYMKQKVLVSRMRFLITVPELDLEPEDFTWLKELEEVFLKNVGNNHYTADNLADDLGMSRSAFYHRLKDLTGQTPKGYMKEYRLQRAKQLLEAGTYTSVLRVAQEVGFTTPHYFSKIYEKKFETKPSSYF